MGLLQYDSGAAFLGKFLHELAFLAELVHQLAILFFVFFYFRLLHLLDDGLQRLLHDAQFVAGDEAGDNFFELQGGGTFGRLGRFGVSGSDGHVEQFA